MAKPFFTAVSGFSEELECALCLDSWKNPVELVPCGHIFCSECLPEKTKKCPLCRGAITSRKPPHRTLVNLALELTVQCSQCGWKGAREQSATHTCSPPEKPKEEVKETTPAKKTEGKVKRPSKVNGSAKSSKAGTASSSGGASPNDPASPKVPVKKDCGPLPPGNTPWVQYGMSKEEYDQIVSLYLNFDEDGNGRLGFTEMKKLARWLNFAHTTEQITVLFAAMDADGSGEVTLEELLNWLKDHRPNPDALYGLSPFEYNTVMMQFHSFDRDEDGKLSLDDFTRLCIQLGEVANPNDARRVFLFVDADRNGAIDLQEYLMYRVRRKQAGY